MTDSNGNGNGNSEKLVRITYYQKKYTTNSEVEYNFPAYFVEYMTEFCHIWHGDGAKSTVEIEGISSGSIIQEWGKKSVKWFIPEDQIAILIRVTKLLKNIDDRIKQVHGEDASWYTLGKNVKATRKSLAVALGVEVEKVPF